MTDKEQAKELLTAGKSVEEVAEELNLPASLIDTWRPDRPEVAVITQATQLLQAKTDTEQLEGRLDSVALAIANAIDPKEPDGLRELKAAADIVCSLKTAFFGKASTQVAILNSEKGWEGFKSEL